MGLRDYQTEDLGKLANNIKDSINRNLCIWPTGSGKTCLLAHIPDMVQLRRGNQALMLVHRQELVSQTEEKLRYYNPDLHIDVEKAERRADPDAEFIIASVQSVGRSDFDEDNKAWNYSDRLTKFDSDSIRHIITDECHHANSARTYHAVYRYFGVMESEGDTFDPTKTHTGVTATPHPKGLSHIYESVAFERTLRDMISLGWLAPPRCFRVNTTVSIDHVGKSNGDFIISELEKAVNTPARNNIVIDNYIEHGENFQFLAFTVDVQHSIDLCEAFNKRGIKTAWIAGSTPKDERRATLEAFREGYIKGLVSCAVLSEGTDLPMASVALLCRPTQSQTLYVQQLGRVLRPFPSPEDLESMMGRGEMPKWIKPYAICLDFVDVTTRHALQNISSLFGLSPNFDFAGQDAVKTVEKIEKIASEKQGLLNISSFNDLTSLESFSQRVDLFATPVVPDEIKSVSQFSWLRGGMDGGYSISLPESKVLTVTMGALDKYKVMQSVKGISSYLGEADTLSEAISKAERHIPADTRAMLAADAKWRSGVPSQNQLDYLWKLSRDERNAFGTKEKFDQYAAQNYSKGDVSLKISSLVSRKR